MRAKVSASLALEKDFKHLDELLKFGLQNFTGPRSMDETMLSGETADSSRAPRQIGQVSRELALLFNPVRKHVKHF